MNHLSKSVAIAVAVALIVPFSAFAQETSVTVQSETAVTTSGTEGGATTDTSASGSVKSPRDSASGQSTGKREQAKEEMEEKRTFVIPHVLERRENLMASTTQKREEAKERAEEKRKNMQERREEAKKKIIEKRSEILKRLALKIIGRMNAAIERIEKLSDRLESRVAKFKEKGVDTSNTEALLVIAETKLAEARALVALGEGSLGEAVVVADLDADGDLDAKVDHGKPVREALAAAKDAVHAAHKAVVEAIASLKASAALRVEATVEGSASSGVQ